MERTQRTVVFALIGIISVGLAALIASLVVPYNVTFGALLTDMHGTGHYTRLDRPPTPLSAHANLALPVGSTVQLEPKSRATLSLEMTGGRVMLTGPATLTLVDSYRRATSLGHLLESERFTRQYVITLRQTQGTAYYDFSITSPPFDTLTVTVELPQTHYIPTHPCWEITVQPDGSAQANDIPCR